MLVISDIIKIPLLYVVNEVESKVNNDFILQFGYVKPQCIAENNQSKHSVNRFKPHFNCEHFKMHLATPKPGWSTQIWFSVFIQ